MVKRRIGGKMPEKVLFSWSGGKDSALALYELSDNPKTEVAALLSVVIAEEAGIGMHGIDHRLLALQAEALGLPLEIIHISAQASEVQYARQMTAVLNKYRAQGISAVAFGDLFLQELRDYRAAKLQGLGMEARFPLWQKDTEALAHHFIALGFKAVITNLDTRRLSPDLLGCRFDEQFLTSLPEGVDPCGENGEFHSFVFAGPIFQQAVPYQLGPALLREEHFIGCKVIPAAGGGE
jgi:uncharacterized protein (TIGR00290 family)